MVSVASWMYKRVEDVVKELSSIEWKKLAEDKNFIYGKLNGFLVTIRKEDHVIVEVREK